MDANNKNGISIFVRILLWFLLVSTVTSASLLFTMYVFSTASMERRANESITQQIDTIHDRFDQQYRTEVTRALRGLVSSTLLDDYLFASSAQRTVSIKRVEKLFRNTLTDFSDFERVLFADYAGSVPISVARRDRRRTGVGHRKLGQSINAELDLIGRRLFERVASVPLLLSSGNMEWFMPPREMHVEGPFKDDGGSISALVGMAKLDLDTAAFGGVLMIRVSLDAFLSNLRDVKFFDENSLWVLDAGGRVLQQPENAATTFDPTRHLLEAFQGEPRLNYVSDGLVAYRDFVLSPGQPFLRIAVAVPTSVLHRDVGAAMKFFFAVLLGSAVIVLIVSLYVSRHLTRPIVLLARAASRLARGDLDTSVDLRTTGEVQTLVESFNRMTADLRHTMAARDASVTSLEREVIERTRAETQLKQWAEELTEARIAAESADRAKGEFLATMSHEIRTPINGVLGMTELLLHTQLDDKQERLAATARRSVLTLLDLINDILDLSKIEAGKLDLADEPFDLRELVEDLGQLFAESAHRKGIELVCALPCEGHAAYRGDAGRIRQVLTNLIGNAIKFTERGEVVVYIERFDDAGRAARLRFEVHDSGIGIPESARSRIFDAFSQADGSTTRKYGGSGLGLGISRKLARMMGGDMGVESRDGVGSMFWFDIRLNEVTAPTGDSGLDPAALRGRHVLVADTNAASRRLLERQLESWAMYCEAVATGDEALLRMRHAAARGASFDYILVGRRLPDMDGVAVVRKARADASLGDARCVLLSAVSDEPQVTDDEAGGVASLQKPVRQAELFRCLSTIAAGGVTVVPAPRAGTTGDPRARATLHGRVLIAEDNPVNQEMASGMLELLGCEAIVVGDGEAAVSALEHERFDLVLMDCQMPVMDGFAATGRVRDAERAATGDARVPIVALTANALRGQREHCIDAGMDDYLAKPFTLDQLEHTLSRWLDEREPDGADSKRQPARVSAGAGDAPDQARSPASVDTELLDQRAIDNIRSLQRPGEEDVLIRYLRLYAQTSKDLIERLVRAVSTQDAEEVNQAAHALKSSSANVGGTALATLCRKLEETGRLADLSEAADLLGEVVEQNRLVCAALSRHCGARAA